MENALDKALANASLNAKMNGDTLHTENLDSIADPSFHEPDPDYPPYVVVPKPPEYDPKTVAFNSDYQQKMQEEYRNKVAPSNATASSISHLSVLVQGIQSDVHHIINMIQTAAQSMSQEPTLKHRSLHEWDDSTLLNELVERENDLMPFYYELLKRIGSPELQSLVMSSMQGKNASMVTLAQLCAALAPQPVSQVQLTRAQQMTNTERMLNQPSYEEYTRANAQHPEGKYGQTVYPSHSDYQATVMNEIPQQKTAPIPQYFETLPTYNPCFKER